MTASRTFFTPFSDQPESLEITPLLVEQTGLAAWAATFKLGTAGYRDLLTFVPER